MPYPSFFVISRPLRERAFTTNATAAGNSLAEIGTYFNQFGLAASVSDWRRPKNALIAENNANRLSGLKIQANLQIAYATSGILYFRSNQPSARTLRKSRVGTEAAIQPIMAAKKAVTSTRQHSPQLQH